MNSQPPPFGRPAMQQIPRTAKAPKTERSYQHKLVGGRAAGLLATIHPRDMDTLKSGGMVRFVYHADGACFSRRQFEYKVDMGKLDPSGMQAAHYRLVKFTVPHDLQEKFAWWMAPRPPDESDEILVYSIVPVEWTVEQAKALAIMTHQHSFAEALPRVRPGVTTTMRIHS